MQSNNNKETRNLENDKKDAIEIINGNIKKLNEFCSGLGKYYAVNNLSTSQLRNVFNDIQMIREYDEVKLQILRPKLAYIAGRHSKTWVIKENFQPLIDNLIQKVNIQNFNNFKNFIEAIVAYHRFHGGKE